MSRKPLSSRNEHPPRRGAPGPKSKKKGRGFTINIAILVSDFNNILKEVTLYGPVVITEDDLRSPTVGPDDLESRGTEIMDQEIVAYHVLQ